MHSLGNLTLIFSVFCPVQSQCALLCLLFGACLSYRYSELFLSHPLTLVLHLLQTFYFSLSHRSVSVEKYEKCFDLVVTSSFL
jgi:hypothetical protein